MFGAILLAICCSFAAFIIHIFLSLSRKGRDRDEPLILELNRQMKLVSMIWFSTFLIYAILFFLESSPINTFAANFNSKENLIGFIYGIIFYSILSFTYLTIYYLVDRSVSATLLEMIENSPEGKLAEDEIKTTYNIERKYQDELTGMLEGGFIIEEADYYRNSLKGRLYARMARLMKRLLRLGSGG